jgi:26S proteasome regulatory subunit N3
MPSKTPRGNGKQPAENGSARGGSKEAGNKAKGKKGTDKDGDDEMTVVVPPSKKSGALTAADADGDVSMGGDEGDAEVKVDPVAQTIAGE